MALTTVEKVRLMTNISITDVSDEDLESLIAEATKEIMYSINIIVIREPVKYIDPTRENDIDGTNSTYYIKNWEGKFISDGDFDGDIDTSDIKVYAVDRNSDNTETELTVSSITYNQGKFVLSSAPSDSNDLFVSYSYSYFDPVTPDPLLGLAATYLTAAYAYLKRDVGMSGTQKFGNVTINTKISDTYGMYYKRYKDIMDKINSYGGLDKSWIDSEVHI